MKSLFNQPFIKLVSFFITLLAAGILFYIYIFTPAKTMFSGRSAFSTSVPVLTVWWLFLMVIVSDLFFRRKFSLYAAPGIYVATFFMIDDALWAAELVWVKSYTPIAACLLCYILALGLVVYRMDPELKWVFKTDKNKNPGPARTALKGLTFWNKITSVIAFPVLCVVLLYVPFKVLLTAGYVTGRDLKVIDVKITGNGSVRGKYYYHRYWKFNLDGNNVKFWVYAAAKMEPLESHSCATADPGPGSVLTLQIRKSIFGTSYVGVLKIRDAKGKIICE